MKTKDAKIFLTEQLWSNTFAASFQRAYVYKGKPNDTEKLALKKALRNRIEAISREEYSNVNQVVSDAQHITNIHSIIETSRKFGSILNGEEIKFGVAQKLLNLYLKYVWLMFDKPTSPHFPVDRMIQVALGIKEKDIVSWTIDLDEKSYMNIIKIARNKLNPNESLAEFELRLYNEQLMKK
jgi:hypothetical protein